MTDRDWAYEQAERLVNVGAAESTIADALLQAVERGRREMLPLLELALEHGRHPGSCGWWDGRYKEALLHDEGRCDCYLSQISAAVNAIAVTTEEPNA